jgi:hypothetical protein
MERRMANLPVERLRDFLRDLKPEARVMLVAELERARLRGDDLPAADLVLEELRKSLPETERKPPRIGDPARLFCEPLEPFLINDKPDRKDRGRISRQSLEAIWLWLTRDLVPVEAKAYSEQVSRQLLAGDRGAADLLARAFQDRALQRIQEALAAVGSDSKASRRLAGQIGVPQAIEELREIVNVLKAREALAVVGSRLPTTIKNLADEQLDNVKTLLDSPVAQHRDIFLYSLVLVRSRLGTPCQLIRLAVKAAASDAAARIAETSYAVAVTIVLADLERAVARLRVGLKSGDLVGVAPLLKEIHDTARALRTEVELGDSPWARQLAQVRSDVSEVLKVAIETAPGRVRRLLGPRSRRDISANAELDSIEVADTAGTIELVCLCRNYAGELAANEVTLRVYCELQSYLDTGMTPLLDALRQASDTDRKFRQSQVDAAVRFSAKIFGPSYAQLFAKAAEVAAQGERKAAKA